MPRTRKAAAAANDTAEEIETPETPTKPDRKRLVDLFHEWEKRNAARKAAEKTLDEVTAKASLAVKAIFEYGGKGPYGYHGAKLTVIRRGPTEKNPDAKESYYFRGEREEEVAEVE